MNPMAQSDPHPDADLLNAFVERALPENERARIVSHMAGCARCREVVYLAQAASEPETPAPVLKPKMRPGWFSPALVRWRVALIPATALAAVGGIAFWVQMHPRPAVELAQLAPQAASARPETDSLAVRQVAPPAPDRNHAGASPELSPEARPRKAARIPGPGPTHSDTAGSGTAALDQFAGRTAPAIAAPIGQGDAIHLDARSASLARYAPTPQPAPPGGPPLAASSAARAAFAPQPLNGPAVLLLARSAKLPSGLNPVSSAALLNRLLAVDSAGSVFLSQDGGKQWEPVRSQWSGKVVEVQAPPVPALFRLVTDRRLVWVSPDGKVWSPQSSAPALPQD